MAQGFGLAHVEPGIERGAEPGGVCHAVNRTLGRRSACSPCSRRSGMRCPDRGPEPTIPIQGCRQPSRSRAGRRRAPASVAGRMPTSPAELPPLSAAQLSHFEKLVAARPASASDNHRQAIVAQLVGV
jgi:hypothetical protein